MAFTDREFRDALGHFSTGVAVVAADDGGERLGATVSSFNSVSLAPPLVLFSLARSLRALPRWQAAKAFAIMVLGEGQDGLSNRFARSGGEKWDGIPDRRAANGAPLLSDWLACFECTPHARYDGGDHEIFVLRVTAFKTRPAPAHPLVFYSGKYRKLSLEEEIWTPADADLWLHGW